MKTITRHDTGAAVEDVQRRLIKAGYLDDDQATGVFDAATTRAVADLCRDAGIEVRDGVDEVVWTRLVDASFELGDRNLFLRVPFFHGRDVKILQGALSVLGFTCGDVDGIFGPHTEDALRRFQLNMGLPSDGIAGAFTFRALNNLQHSWKDKDARRPMPHLGFARAYEALETHMLCLFGVGEFTRAVAARMSNLALATNPASKVTSADSLLVSPDETTVFVQILVGDESPAQTIPVVDVDDEATLASRLAQAFVAARYHEPCRIALRLPSESWEDAGQARSAQHYAVVLLDALCAALLLLK